MIKSITVTYPDFQSLPKGIKKLLVASESFFFREARSRLAQSRAAAVKATASVRTTRARDFGGLFSAFNAAWRN